MSRRALILLFVAALLGAGLWWLTTLIPSPPPRTLAQWNAPPTIDPACPERLRGQSGVRIALADPFERTAGCVVDGAVLVRELAGLRLRPAGALMRCEVAEALHQWLEREVKPEAEEHLGSALSEVHHIGTYNCRRIANSPRLSQHSFANAIDITAFVLADGRKLTLLRGWNAESQGVQAFWQRIHRRSCRHFSVALGPNFNAAHADHFHFDLGPARACR